MMIPYGLAKSENDDVKMFQVHTLSVPLSTCFFFFLFFYLMANLVVYSFAPIFLGGNGRHASTNPVRFSDT